MARSLQDETLAGIYDAVSSAEPTPAGVAMAAATAALALGLVEKTLRIAARRPDADLAQLNQMIAAAGIQAGILLRQADEDIAAFEAYLQALRLGETPDCRTVAVSPLVAARACVAGLEICVAALGLVPRSVVADAGSAAAMLAGAAEAMLLTVHSNLPFVNGDHAVAAEAESLREQLRVLRERARAGRPWPA